MFNTHHPPSSAEVKNEWRYTSTPTHAFVSKHGKLHLYILLVTLWYKKVSWVYFRVLREQQCWEYTNLSEYSYSVGTSIKHGVSPSNWQGNVGQKHHWLLYSFFCVIPQRLNFMCRRFGTPRSNFIGGVSRKNAYTAYEDETECSEMSVHKFQTPGNHP